MAIEKENTEINDRKVTIMIPITAPDQPDVGVYLNDKYYVIKRGEPVEVPLALAEIILGSEEMKMKNMKYMQKAMLRNENK